jgi:hypothetical protein
MGLLFATSFDHYTTPTPRWNSAAYQHNKPLPPPPTAVSQMVIEVIGKGLFTDRLDESVNDVDGFRRSKTTILADLSRAVEKGSKYR